MQTNFKFKMNVEMFPPLLKNMFYVKYPVIVPFWEVDWLTSMVAF